MKKTTKAEYNRFKKSLSEWCSKLNLGCWDITVAHVKSADGTYASVSSDIDTMTAFVSFNKELPDADHGEDFPEKIGKHEAIHILLAEYSSAACNRFMSLSELDRHEEKVVLALTKVL